MVYNNEKNAIFLVFDLIFTNTNIFELTEKGKYEYDYIWLKKRGQLQIQYEYLDWYLQIRI